MTRLGAVRRLQTAAGGDDETTARSRTSALVLAPHQDDETLGCGGTIILKTRSGARVSCVFLTDGSTSHSAFLDARTLSHIRRKEALNATGTLGVTRSDVYFWDYPDGRLIEHRREAVQRVAALVDRLRPDEVYVPYRSDGTPDHEATFAIAAQALTESAHSPEVVEYPVWFWNRWPWVPLELSAGRDTLRSVKWALEGRLGARIRQFRTRVRVGPVLAQKRLALNEHRTQMTNLQPGSNWPILADVSRGSFLECFFQEFERFRCTASGALRQ